LEDAKRRRRDDINQARIVGPLHTRVIGVSEQDRIATNYWALESCAISMSDVCIAGKRRYIIDDQEGHNAVQPETHFIGLTFTKLQRASYVFRHVFNQLALFFLIE
jgi:hypothetical protein